MWCGRGQRLLQTQAFTAAATYHKIDQDDLTGAVSKEARRHMSRQAHVTSSRSFAYAEARLRNDHVLRPSTE